jgi:ribA/ribD-fused uncharacterized protein
MIAFYGKNSPYSNFHYVEFEYKGYKVTSSEQAFMLEKALMFDKSMVKPILATTDPRAIKRLGRKVRNFDEKKWNKVRYDIMVDILLAKFSNEPLKSQLLSTGDELMVEASPNDKIWGAGLAIGDARLNYPNYYPGQNLLGKALMEARTWLRNM